MSAAERLDEIDALTNAATAGPWHWAGNTDTADRPGIDPDDAAAELAWMRGEA